MRRWATLITMAFAAGGVAGQTTQPATEFYEAEVVGQDVYVRSSHNPNAYYCTQLSSPSRVMVVGSDPSGKWYKILPPPGCYSVISKAHVRLDAGGRTATVTGNDVSARAGGYPSQPGNFSILQKVMKAGDRVRIVGTIGENYKIEPPRGAYFWISARYVRRLAAATTEPSAATTVDVMTDPTMIAYQALRKELIAEWKKPAIQRDYLALAAKFKALKVSKASGLQSYVDNTVKFLHQQQQRLLDKAVAARTIAAADDIDAKLRGDLVRLALGAATKPAIKPTARGIVTVSAVYPGCPAIARRLVLRDDRNLNIKAYLQVSPDGGGENLLNCVGMLVNVYGPLRHDRSLAMNVVQVERVDVLDRDAVLPAVPEATLAPIEIKAPATTQPAATQPAATQPTATQPTTQPAS